MSIQENVEVVKEYFAAIGSGDKQWSYLPRSLRL